MTTNHSNCDHPATKAGRAACRKARATGQVEAQALIAFFDSCSNTLGIDWVIRGAARFGSYQGTDRMEAAAALVAYFAPSGDDARDADRRRNGYTITTSPSEIRSIILRAAS